MHQQFSGSQPIEYRYQTHRHTLTPPAPLLPHCLVVPVLLVNPAEAAAAYGDGEVRPVIGLLQLLLLRRRRQYCHCSPHQHPRPPAPQSASWAASLQLQHQEHHQPNSSSNNTSGNSGLHL
ncbi:hypothetical protein PLESTM_001355000 [Pleodorina starrii]|nr:hypothetical protein PLESTM_001355000 [Pleodorina starrii]